MITNLQKNKNFARDHQMIIFLASENFFLIFPYGSIFNGGQHGLPTDKPSPAPTPKKTTNKHKTKQKRLDCI